MSAKAPHEPVDVALEEGQTVATNRGGWYVEPQSKQVVRIALSCKLPDCPGKRVDGKPYLFCSVKDSGHADLPPESGKWPVATVLDEMLLCPACGRNAGVHHYESPEILARRKLLEEELSATRAARRAAKQAGKPMPTDHRTPAAIMQDLSNLPKVYLLPE